MTNETPTLIPGTFSPTFALGGDLTVRRIGYGAMRLADGPAPAGADPATAAIWRPPADRAAAVALLRRAVELGVDLIDTADAYALGGNEELVAEALHPFDGVAVATKVGVVRPGPGEWVPLGHPAYLRQQAELSLRRLRVERIDLLQLHRIDPAYPLAEQLGALRQLVEEGKVRQIGLSEVTADQLRAALELVPIAAVNNLYNLTARHHEPVVELAAERGVAFLPFFPVAMGAHATDGGELAEVAKELDATPAQTSLAWLLHRSPALVPIPGTSSPAHLAENVAALELRLSPEQQARLSVLGAASAAAGAA